LKASVPSTSSEPLGTVRSTAPTVRMIPATLSGERRSLRPRCADEGHDDGGGGAQDPPVHRLIWRRAQYHAVAPPTRPVSEMTTKVRESLRVNGGTPLRRRIGPAGKGADRAEAREEAAYFFFAFFLVAFFFAIVSPPPGPRASRGGWLPGL